MLSRYLPRKSKREPLTVISKGASDVLKIDKDEIQRTIQRLRENYGLLVTQVNSALSRDIETIREYVKQFHKTSAYEEFYRLIIAQFGDLKEILPGTIGAFCAGYYFYKGGVDDKRCAATCIDSIPLPTDDVPTPCKSTVVLLCNNGGSIICIPLTTGDRSLPGYFYLMGDRPYPETAEVEKFVKTFGLAHYRLYSYDGAVYQELVHGVSTVDNKSLTLRPSFQSDHERHRSVRRYRSDGDSSGVLLAVALFVLLIVLVGAFIAMKKR